MVENYLNKHLEEEKNKAIEFVYNEYDKYYPRDKETIKQAATYVILRNYIGVTMADVSRFFGRRTYRSVIDNLSVSEENRVNFIGSRILIGYTVVISVDSCSL